MARSAEELTRLADELAALTPEERKKVIKQAEDSDWTKHVVKIPRLARSHDACRQSAAKPPTADRRHATADER
jgi:hypothetical protein